MFCVVGHSTAWCGLFGVFRSVASCCVRVWCCAWCCVVLCATVVQRCVVLHCVSHADTHVCAHHTVADADGDVQFEGVMGACIISVCVFVCVLFTDMASLLHMCTCFLVGCAVINGPRPLITQLYTVLHHTAPCYAPQRTTTHCDTTLGHRKPNLNPGAVPENGDFGDSDSEFGDNEPVLRVSLSNISDNDLSVANSDTSRSQGRTLTPNTQHRPSQPRRAGT